MNADPIWKTNFKFRIMPKDPYPDEALSVNAIRVVIALPDKKFAYELSEVLEVSFRDRHVHVVGFAFSALTVRATILLRPDIVFLHTALRDGRVQDIVPVVRHLVPMAKIIGISRCFDPETEKALRGLGVTAYFSENDNRIVMLDLVDRVLALPWHSNGDEMLVSIQ